MFGLKRRQSSLAVDVRWIEPRDIAAVLAIERSCFLYPWKKRDLNRVLGKKGNAGVVAEVRDAVKAFIIVRRPYSRRGIAPMEILNLAVDEQFRRRGIGRKLVQSIDNRAGIVAEVGELNLDAQLFFRSLGFRATGIIPQPFDDCQDGYRFVYNVK